MKSLELSSTAIDNLTSLAHPNIVLNGAVYTNANRKRVRIQCRKHKNVFYEQSIVSIKKGIHACKSCKCEELLQRCEKRKDKNLKFEIPIVITPDKKLLVKCSKHSESGSFLMLIKSILNGSTGCKQCRSEKISSAISIPKSAFLEKAPKCSDPCIDLSHDVYTNMQTKMKVSCKKHPDQGFFFMSPRSILSGCNGCKQCLSNKLSKSAEEYIDKASKAVPDLDFSRAVYTDRNTPISGVYCRKHPEAGELTVHPSSAFKGGTGCPKCKGEKISRSRTKPASDFFSKAARVSDPNLDFSHATYTNSHTRITGVSCSIHPEVGEFAMYPSVVLNGGTSCPTCVSEKNKVRCTLTQEDFLERCANDAVPSLDFSKAVYKQNKALVEVSCKKHPDNSTFYMFPGNIYAGKNGCKLCIAEKFEDIAKERAILFEDFKSRVSNSNPNLDVSQFVYTNNRTPSFVSCRLHPEVELFPMNPSNLYKGRNGCGKCCSVGVSKKEREVVEFISSVYKGRIIANTKRVIPPKELDIYLPDLKIAIEFNGCYWHSDNQGKDLNYHKDKYSACVDKGIQLIQIWEDDWDNKQNIIKRMLDHKLGLSNLPRIYARNTVVVMPDKNEADDFLNHCHIQGAVNATYYLGLKDDQELVALMTLTRTANDGELLLSRYATSKRVVGGFSKLMSHVRQKCLRNDFRGRNDTPVTTLISFSDNEVSDGGMYKNNGWVKVADVPVSYSYWRIDRPKREHKFNYRLKRFRNDPELIYEDGLTEKELAELNGLVRCYDSGKQKWRFVIAN